MKILIGYDGSECSDNALLDLHDAGLPTNVEAVVVSVSESWFTPPAAAMLLAPPADDVPAHDLPEASEIAARAVKRLRLDFPEWDVRAAVYKGAPAEEILARAAEWSPDLVVVGSHGLSALDVLILGSVSHAVAEHAHASVRIARGREGVRNRPLRIMIGLDGSPPAEEAVRAVAERSWPPGTEVKLLTVFDERLKKDPFLDAELGRIDQMQWAAAQRLREAGIATSHTSAPGDPARVIAQHADDWNADAIFVGSRGLGRIATLLLGSVASGVASRAHCSVEIVKRR